MTANPPNVTNQTRFLRTTRNFPQDPQALSVEMNRAYSDTAGAVNERTIGIFPINRPVQNGEQWFYQMNARQQGLRQIYTLPPLVAPHNIANFGSIAFTRIYGTAFDGNIWYPLPYVESNGNPNNQIKLRIDSVNYNVDVGSTAPAIVQGFLILEWLSQP
jgi:hypothetical protein